MKWLKGIGLLLIANVLIFVTLSITFHVLVNFVLPAFGIDVRRDGGSGRGGVRRRRGA